MAKSAGWTNVISHRSARRGHHDRRSRGRRPRGPDQDRRALPQRPRRQYNRLLGIEEELEGVATYPGRAAFPRFRA